MKHRIKEIVREEILSIIIKEQHQYKLSDLEELNEYMWLRPNYTRLGVDIFVDDGGSYIRHDHELLLFARNGYGRECNSFIPFSVSEKPNVLDDEMSFNISYDVIFLIQDFIQANLSILIDLANGNISQESFVQNIQYAMSYSITEIRRPLLEMATLKASDSNLPMDIWLDEGGTYQGHAPRIKFRASNEQRTTREFSSMLLTDPPSIENMPSNSPLRKRDIEKLEQFVINNLDNLLRLANGEIDYLNDFKPNMIKG